MSYTDWLPHQPTPMNEDTFFSSRSLTPTNPSKDLPYHYGSLDLLHKIKITAFSVRGTFFSNNLALFINGMGKLGKWRLCVQKLPPRHCTLFPLNALIQFRIWILSRSRVWGRDWAPFLTTNTSIKLFEMDFVFLPDSLYDLKLLTLYISTLPPISVSWSDKLVQIKDCCTPIERLIR